MRLLYTLFSLAACGYGFFYLTDKNPDLKQKMEELIDFRTTNALEIRYGAQQIMESHQKTLLKEKGSRFLDPELKFYPFLVIEVKYSDRKKTKEGLILWDLTDGEMVLETKHWGKTHGFADCILTNALIHEFKVLHVMAEKGGSCDESQLLENLDVEMPILEMVLRSCLKKNLIVSNGNSKYRLHLKNPYLPTSPETKISEPLTLKAHKKAIRAPRHFSPSQVEKIARIAFGKSFSIRKTTEIYLPVHRIVVQNPTGAIHTTHYNALTGKPLPSASFYQ